MASPDKGGWQNTKDIMALLLIAPAVIVLTRPSITGIEVTGSGDIKTRAKVYKNGHARGNLRRKGPFSDVLQDGGTFVGTIAEEPIVIWDFPGGHYPEERGHTGRMCAKIGGEVTRRLSDTGKIIFNMIGGQTVKLRHGEKAEGLGTEGNINLTYTSPNEDAAI